MARKGGTARQLYVMSTKVPEELYIRLDHILKRQVGRHLYDEANMSSILRQALAEGVAVLEAEEDALDRVQEARQKKLQSGG